MGFEQSKFGDGSAAGSGNVVTTVSNHYGPRETGKTQGVMNSSGAKHEMVLELDGDMLTAGDFPLLDPKLPANVLVTAAYFEVEEAFVLGGTTPTILVGTDTSEVTNGLVISEAQAEAVGVYDVTSTLTGTWAAGLTAATTVGLALGGTSPTSTSAGKGRVVVEYVNV